MSTKTDELEAKAKKAVTAWRAALKKEGQVLVKKAAQLEAKIEEAKARVAKFKR